MALTGPLFSHQTVSPPSPGRCPPGFVPLSLLVCDRSLASTRRESGALASLALTSPAGTSDQLQRSCESACSTDRGPGSAAQALRELALPLEDSVPLRPTWIPAASQLLDENRTVVLAPARALPAQTQALIVRPRRRARPLQTCATEVRHDRPQPLAGKLLNASIASLLVSFKPHASPTQVPHSRPLRPFLAPLCLAHDVLYAPVCSPGLGLDQWPAGRTSLSPSPCRTVPLLGQVDTVWSFDRTP